MPKKHYVCSGDCASVSLRPGICNTNECIREGEPYTECACEDGMHEMVHQKNRPQEIDI